MLARNMISKKLNDMSPTSPKSRLVTVSACVLLGAFGIHRFYLNCPFFALGILALQFVPNSVPYSELLGWVPVVIDFVLSLTGRIRDGRGFVVRRWKPPGYKRPLIYVLSAGVLFFLFLFFVIFFSGFMLQRLEGMQEEMKEIRQRMDSSKIEDQSQLAGDRTVSTTSLPQNPSTLR